MIQVNGIETTKEDILKAITKTLETDKETFGIFMRAIADSKEWINNQNRALDMLEEGKNSLLTIFFHGVLVGIELSIGGAKQ